jgi:hypothetical protein
MTALLYFVVGYFGGFLMPPFYHKESANQEDYKGKREPVEIFFHERADFFALEAHQPVDNKEPYRIADVRGA